MASWAGPRLLNADGGQSRVAGLQVMKMSIPESDSRQIGVVE